jgi:hypothetical protein
MSTASWTKGTRARGIQTRAAARRLPEPLVGAELQYLDLRDWYLDMLNQLAQYNEMLSQSQQAHDKAATEQSRNKIHYIQADLTDTRQRVRNLGEKAFAEAFYLAAERMLPRDIFSKINQSAESLLGRERHELSTPRR